MYGFHKEDKFPSLINDSVNIFGVYNHGIHITLHSGRTIIVNGIYEIVNKRGESIFKLDAAKCHLNESFIIGPLLSKKIVEIRVEEPKEFTIGFDNGYSLTKFDNDSEKEACNIAGFHV